MDPKKVNLLHSIFLLVLGILMILIGLFSDRIPHEMRLVIAAAQILIGCATLATSILKIKGKF